ncbi:MAG: hypothetical protein IJ568_05950 [Bacilli bacterium]|nr:hypothetical protein [Bacilli bacterium]
MTHNDENNSLDELKSIEIKKAESFSNIITDITDYKDMSQRLSSTFSQKNGKYKSRYRDHVKHKKIFFVLAAIFIILGGVLTFIKKDEYIESSDGKRTVMIYMIGSDLETKYYAATTDIKEMINSNINYEDVNILIYTGGAKKWHTDSIPNNRHALFELNSSGLELIEEYDVSSNMLDPYNLSYLLKYGYENYKTEFYDLILWDHGAGPIYGYGYDEYNVLDSMSLEEVRTALENSPFNGANKLELVGFDACLMSSIEVASVLSDYASYMVASQEVEPGAGWDYSFLSNTNRKMDSIKFGESIINTYESYYEKRKYIKGISLSLLKLNKVENVEKALNNLFSSMDENLVIEFSNVSRSRSSSKSFGRIANEDYYYDLVDLNDLISKLPEKYYDDVNILVAALQDLVIYQKTDLEDTNGVSIYFPYENKKQITAVMDVYKDLNFATSYYNYIGNFASKLTGKKIANWDLSKSKIESLGESEVSISLPIEVIENFSTASYIIFEKTTDGLFIPIFTGTDIKIEGNKLSTTVSRKAILAEDDEGNKLYMTALESEKGNDYVKYHIPALISRFNDETFEVEVQAVFLGFVVDNEHPDGYVATVTPAVVNQNYTYSNYEIDLNEWDSLSLVSYKYNILNDDGKYTKDWEASKEIIGLDITIGNDYKIYLSDLDISRDYYSLFEVKDSQGNIYSSNIVEVNNK